MQAALAAVVAFFKYKAVSSVIALVCWPAAEQHRLVSGLWHHGVMATASCPDRPADVLNVSDPHHILGILYIVGETDEILKKAERFHFTTKFKWLIVGNEIPSELETARYDSDVTLMRWEPLPAISGKDPGSLNETKFVRATATDRNVGTVSSPSGPRLVFHDVYVHPHRVSSHPWGSWLPKGLRVEHEMERVRRRYNFDGFEFKIAAPMGLYNRSAYGAGFRDYLVDERTPQLESATRCTFAFVITLFEPLNLTAELVPTVLWSSHAPGSSSMARLVSEGEAQVGGSVLRILRERLDRFDFVSAIWPFRVGFIYVATRESSSNMFAAPFSHGVWWACAGASALLALALFLSARGRREREGAVYSAIATCLQQDASAVPEGASGRAVFLVLSVCSMLLHSYYTSAVVSSLLHSGRGGPRTIRDLADSSLKAAAEDYDYVHYLFFDVRTTWDDLEYFKKKKKTSSFYQTLERGVELVGAGTTAFHTEFNGIYPHLARRLPDSDLCRLRHVDTIPEVNTYVVASKHSEYSSTLKAKSQWLHETGIARRIVSKWRARSPTCRAALLAERVKMADVMPLAFVMAAGAATAILLLLLERAVHRSHFNCGSQRCCVR